MASVVPQPQVLPEPPRKRQKLSPPPHQAHVPNNAVMNSISETQSTVLKDAMSQRDREARAGILCFVNESNPGFSGILKQRYTDFLVNEVTLDGNVVHLTNSEIPRRKPANHVSGYHRTSPPPTEAPAKVEENVSSPADAVVHPVAQEEPPEKISKVDNVDNVSSARLSNEPALSVDDIALLDSYFGVTVRTAILKLNEKVLLKPQAKPGSWGSVSSEPITDRQFRGKLHQDMRRIFGSRFETATGADDVVTITVAPKIKPQGRVGHDGNGRDNGRNRQAKGRLGWQELGGEHLHFSLYKENKDTMEVIAYISAQLRTSPKQFSFAGTKDRRGVTVQRVSVFRVYADALANLNRTLRGSKVGNFKYEKNRLELGDLMGNEFLITLRDCTFGSPDTAGGMERAALADKVIGTAMKNMQVHGFINYYGLQRFGTYSVGTDDVGKKILQGDFEGAINAILAYGEDALACALDPAFVPADGKSLPRDDIARAEALHIFKTAGESQTALDKLPRKFSGEISIIRYLKRSSRDFVGALLQIPRNLRLMYVHAYQSLVWNMAASERWTRHGGQVVKGDLVLIDSASTKHIQDVNKNEFDDNGEVIVLPSAGDAAASHDDIFERARALSAEEAASGKYTIFDIVLPTPGYDIEYPGNDVGDYYKEFMTSDRGGGLDPGNMRRAQRDFSLSGSYRKLLGQIGNDVTYEIKLYKEDKEQMVETDLEKMAKSRANNGARNHVAQSCGALENGGSWRDHQHGGDREAKPNSWSEIHRQDHSKQRDAWKNFPSKLAADEKAEAELFDAKKAAEAKMPKVALPQPIYNDTFIQTSAEHGKRTGHRETTIVPGVKVDAPGASVEDLEPVKDGDIRGDEIATEAELGAANKSKLDIMEDVEGSAPGPNAPRGALPAETETKAQEEETVNQGTPNGTPMTIPEETGRQAVQESAMKEASSEKFKEDREKVAIIVKFQLGSSQYATMALRELMKQGGVQTYKPEFGSGR